MTGTFLNQVNAIAYFWGEGELDKEQSAVYDLHEGYLKGVIDFIPDPPTGEWTQNGWQQQIGPYTVGEGCTYLRVNHGPFEPAWMFTPQADASSNPLEVTLTDGTNSVTVTVLGTRINTPDQQAHLELVVQGTSLPAWVDTGVWYHIHGDRYKANVAQSGTWTTPASGSTFTVYGKAGLTSEMQGWILQPDINQQVYLTVETVSPGSGALT
ncbi:MAG: hypothetical protein K8I27_17395, partial [Planctomycetes bacterium]|nr:hypothetical protein [Planctomycetota bacterium]